MKEPTEKQKSFARKIAWVCHKKLPSENISQAYRKFINENMTQYNCECIPDEFAYDYELWTN